MVTHWPTPDPRKRALLGAIATKNRAEVHRVIVTRRRFLARVLDDARTRDLFTRLRRDSRLDLVVTEWRAQLDAAAARLGLPDRSTLLRDAAVTFSRLRPEVVRFFQDCGRLFEIRHDRSVEARAADVLRFIDGDLYTSPPRLRGWLGLALLDAFKAEALGDITGEPMPVTLLTGSLIPLPHKAGYTPDDEKLERGADWYYLAEVASPKMPRGELTRAYISGRKAEGVIIDPDSGLVPERIKEADRLLNRLVIPPVDAVGFLTTTQKHS